MVNKPPKPRNYVAFGKYINTSFVCWRYDLGGRLFCGAPNCALYCVLIYFPKAT